MTESCIIITVIAVVIATTDWTPFVSGTLRSITAATTAIKNSSSGPGQVVHSVGASSLAPNGGGFVHGWSTYLGCGSNPQLRHMQEAADQFLSPIDVSLPPILSL